MKTKTQIEMESSEGQQKVPHSSDDVRASSAVGAQAPPSPADRTWLVRYAVTVFGLEHEASYCDFGLVDAPDIKAAEDMALRGHVPEGFSEDEPFEATNDGGEWTFWNGFRAFELSKDHVDVDSGNIFWVEWIREVAVDDAPILKKYLINSLTWDQLEAEKKEQRKLRRIEFSGQVNRDSTANPNV
jgi:hypothetical protein